MGFGFDYEKTMWRWFVKCSMQWVQVAKIRNVDERAWIVLRGTKSMNQRSARFSTLGDAIAALFDHEIRALLEQENMHAMEFIAMAADDGEMN